MTIRLAFLAAVLVHAGVGLAQSSKPVITDEIRAMLDVIEMEVGRRQAFAPGAAQVLVGDLVRVHDLLAGKPREKTGKSELHVVGLYEPNQRGAKEVVEVTISDRPIVRALCAYEPVRWEVRLAQGAKLERIIVGGYHAQTVTWSDPARAAQVESHTQAGKQPNYFYAYTKNSEEFLKLKERLRQLTGLDVT